MPNRAALVRSTAVVLLATALAGCAATQTGVAHGSACSQVLARTDIDLWPEVDPSKHPEFAAYPDMAALTYPTFAAKMHGIRKGCIASAQFCTEAAARSDESLWPEARVKKPDLDYATFAATVEGFRTGCQMAGTSPMPEGQDVSVFYKPRPAATPHSYAAGSTVQRGYSNGVNEVRPNAYGLGVNSDEYGRPHTYRTQDGQDVGIFNGGVKRDAYGLGVHMDQFGRPVHDSKP